MKPATFLLALAASAVAEEAASTPIQKVITLINGMLETVKKEKHEEEVGFAAYNQMAEDTIAEKTRLIADYTEQMEQQAARHVSENAAADAAAGDASDAAEHMASNEEEMAAARKQREEEHEAFLKNEQDLMESVDALDRAIKTLEKEPKKVAQASLVELSNKKMFPAESMKVVTAFLAEGADPQAHGFESSSGGVIDMLEDLKAKFQQELDEAQRLEQNTQHTHNMFMQDKTGEQNAEKAQKNHSLKLKAEAEQESADAQKEHDQAQDSKDADTEFMNALKAEHGSKKADYEENQKLREEEIVAINKALEILNSNSVAGNASAGAAGLFAQFASVSKANPTQLKAATFLRNAAQRLNSATLSTLAVNVGDSPFESVIRMINELIQRLKQEAAEEAEHAGWCNTELAKNTATRDEKTDEVISQTAKQDKNTATIARLTKEIAEHTQTVADLDASIAEATKLRNEERAANEKTIRESKEAQEAVAKAYAVLEEFYQKAGQSNVRQSGNDGSSSSVLGMLEVIQSDFATLEADTEKAEQDSEQAHNDFMAQSESNKAKHNQNIASKNGQKDTATSDKADAVNDRKNAQEALDIAQKYYQKLKPTCVDSGSSFGDRTAKRQDEIQSLKEALEILEDHDSAP